MEDRTMKEKCRGINLGKVSLNRDLKKTNFKKILKISQKNHKTLQKEIEGPYRFGCI